MMEEVAAVLLGHSPPYHLRDLCQQNCLSATLYSKIYQNCNLLLLLSRLANLDFSRLGRAHHVLIRTGEYGA